MKIFKKSFKMRMFMIFPKSKIMDKIYEWLYKDRRI